ncbi:MAG: hypothetical protein Q9169_004416 [Polycauliona sp. 2 TL-2023]
MSSRFAYIVLLPPNTTPFIHRLFSTRKFTNAKASRKMCTITRRTFSGCAHKAISGYQDRCYGFKEEGDDITCTARANRGFHHRFIEGDCPDCSGPPERKKWSKEELAKMAIIDQARRDMDNDVYD